MTVFPGEQYQAPRSWAEEAYPNLIYFNEVDRADTSQLGSSPSSSAKKSVRPSARFGDCLVELLQMPVLDGAAEWLNSEPLGPAEVEEGMGLTGQLSNLPNRLWEILAVS